MDLGKKLAEETKKAGKKVKGGDAKDIFDGIVKMVVAVAPLVVMALAIKRERDRKRQPADTETELLHGLVRHRNEMNQISEEADQVEELRRRFRGRTADELRAEYATALYREQQFSKANEATEKIEMAVRAATRKQKDAAEV